MRTGLDSRLQQPTARLCFVKVLCRVRRRRSSRNESPHLPRRQKIRLVGRLSKTGLVAKPTTTHHAIVACQSSYGPCYQNTADPAALREYHPLVKFLQSLFRLQEGFLPSQCLSYCTFTASHGRVCAKFSSLPAFRAHYFTCKIQSYLQLSWPLDLFLNTVQALVSLTSNELASTSPKRTLIVREMAVTKKQFRTSECVKS